MEFVGSVTHPTLSAQKSSLKDAPFLSSLRIRKLQQYLKEKKIDGVLAVNGIDSRYNPDARHFINFVLFGCSVYRSGNYTRQQTVVDTDELALMVRQEKVHLYTSSDTYDALFPFLIKIPDLEMHCLDPSLSIDENVVEDHKIYAFISMTSCAPNLAVPHSGKKFDAMSLEKWPIIQAYALENYGSNGFFGLTHNVIPLDFQDIYTSFDLGSLNHLLIEVASLLRYQWNLSIRNVGIQLKNGVTDLSPCLDPIRSYLSHGTGSESVKFEQQNHLVTGAPLFLTMSVSQPAMVCGRTYFVHSSSNTSPDLVTLSIIFDAVVATTQRSIQRFASTQTAGKIQSYFSKKFADKIGSTKHPMLKTINLKSLKIAVQVGGFNVRGEPVDPSSKNSLKTISVSISGIPSTEKPGVVFKPLVYCETFMDSHLQVENGDSSADDVESLMITNVIPTYVQWNSASPGESASCSILSSDLYEGNVVVSDGEMFVTSPFSIPLTIPLSAIKEIRVAKNVTSSISLYIEHTSDCLPPFSKRFCLVFWQRAKAFKYASEVLLPLLKESGVSINSDDLPLDVEIQISALSREDAVTLECSYPTLSNFSPHLMLSSHGKFTYNQRDINPSMVPETTEPSVLITLLIGIPGSNQEKICSLITEECPDQQFIVLRQPLTAPDLYSTDNLQKSVKTLASRGGDPLRVIVIVSAYVSPAEVLSSILQHPDAKTRKACHVCCVNTCVDLRNVFLCNRTVFPKVLEQCQEGWSNNIIVSGQNKKSGDERLAIIRKINSECHIIEMISNNFISQNDLEEICAMDAFSERPLPIFRHLSSPGWYNKGFKDRSAFLDIAHLTVQFEGELCKARFMSHLKSLHQKEGRVYVDRLAMKGSIFYLGGRTKFTDDKSVYSVEFTPRSEAISLTNFTKPLAPGTQNCFVFTGIGLTEAQVKTWLQGCVSRPPTKKSPLTKFSLTKDEKERLKDVASKSPLPEGWFFNGTYYVSMTSGKSSEHPVYGELVEKYVAERNSEVERFNKQVDEFKMLSLFDGI